LEPLIIDKQEVVFINLDFGQARFADCEVPSDEFFKFAVVVDKVKK